MKRFVILIALASALTGFFQTGARAADAAQKSETTPHFTYVIVHGAWGGGWAFKEVDHLLTQDGNTVYRPTLTGQGERSHLASTNIDLDTHIQDIVNVILWENLHDVILVGHSYGGMVITGVADRVPDRIKHVIYLDAFLPENGESVNSTKDGMGLDQPVTNGYVMPVWIKGNEPLPHDVPHPEKTWSEKISLKHQDAARKIPSTFILTVEKGKDPAKDNFYRFYARAKKRGWPTAIMEGDHNVQWSHPKELVKLLEKYAGE